MQKFCSFLEKIGPSVLGQKVLQDSFHVGLLQLLFGLLDRQKLLELLGLGFEPRLRKEICDVIGGRFGWLRHILTFFQMKISLILTQSKVTCHGSSNNPIVFTAYASNRSVKLVNKKPSSLACQPCDKIMEIKRTHILQKFVKRRHISFTCKWHFTE